ncbi:MAG: hypothetical protein GF344_08005 [Chitinivibrionales bacterium]|nr:hypothetical protein [Chitinivibrionales bacterium]MBD3356833.1 hypothetical protein [Chitinivibrionales bacterium]
MVTRARLASPALIVLVAIKCLIAQDTDSVPTNNIVVDSAAETERLRAEIERLRREARTLRAALPDTAAEMERGLVDTVGDEKHLRDEIEAYRDTVVHLTREGVSAFLSSFSGKRRSARERGYGGGGGLHTGIFAVNLNPVKEVIAMEKDLRTLDFPIHGRYESFLLTGGLGYGGIGNGIRIGGGGRSGSRSFTARVNDTTTTSLDIEVGYGGFMAEKCFVRDRLNIIAGGMFGGGSIKVQRVFGAGIWHEIDTNDDAAEIQAGFMLLEAHGAVTWTLRSWFHVGGGISLPFFFAPAGFSNTAGTSITGGFTSVGPGLHLRIVFGNIG